MRLSHLAIAILIVAIWGFNFVVIKIGLHEISPLALCTARFFLASIPAVFFLKRPSAPFKLIILYGLIMFALQFSLLFIGMYAGMTAGLASLLLQIQVFFTILLAGILLKEFPNKWQVIGGLISFSGIVLVAINLGGNITLLSFILIIAAAATWGVGNIYSKRMIFRCSSIPSGANLQRFSITKNSK